MKCLVTKLNGEVNNESLLKVGEMRIKILPVDVKSDATQGFGLSASDVELNIIGNAYFTDQTLTENKGKSITISGNTGIFVSDACEVAIMDKYKLSFLAVYYPGQSSNVYSKNKAFDLESLHYSTDMTSLNISGSQVSGDISALSNLTSLTSLIISGSQVSGDISALSNLTSLTSLIINGSQVSGDITNLNWYLKKVSKEYSLTYCNNLTGDIGSIPDNILFLNCDKAKSIFSWNKGSSRTKILACVELICNNIDDMLNDMANMDAEFAGSEAYKKKISVKGTRTSASDAAVATLQSKGYTVSIIPA